MHTERVVMRTAQEQQTRDVLLLQRSRRWLWRLCLNHGGLLAVLGVALVFRLIYLQWFKAFPPGDVFNFINIARSLPQGQYPLGEKRLPFYPVLLLAARTFFDWELAAIVVAVSASLASLIFLYGIGRSLGLSKTALAAGLLLFQSQPFFLIASGRGYADTTLIALVLGSLLALFRTRTWRGALVTGFLLGAAALTRYEGLAAALAIFLLSFALPLRRSRALPIVSLGMFLLTLAPYAVVAVLNDRPVFGTGYLAEAAATTYGSNAREIRENAVIIWKRAGLIGSWNIPRDMVREILESPLNTPRVIAGYVTDPALALGFFATIGALLLFFSKKWRKLLFLLFGYAAATIPPAWYEPYPRYDIFVLPLAVILFAAGLTGMQRILAWGTNGIQGKVVRILAGLGMLSVVAGFWMMGFAAQVRTQQQKHNGQAYAFYQAIHAARRLHGTIAFEKEPDIIHLYFGGRAVFLQRLVKQGQKTQEILSTLRQTGVTTLVLRAEEAERYPFLEDPSIQLVQSFAWEQGNRDIDRAAIYRLSESATSVVR